MPNAQGNVVSQNFEVTPGWEKWFCLMSDNHHDSVYCNRDLELQQLEQAKRVNADIYFFGDVFDAMQGRFDPRRSYSELREEYRVPYYYDALVDDFANFYGPYAENIRLFGRGNHENSVIKNANTDLLERLVSRLNLAHQTNIQVGGYGGWIRLLFNLSGGLNTGPRTSFKIKYFHGAGAEAPVTRGVIQTNRQAVYLPDANLVVNGHNHSAYYVPIVRERLSNKGVLYMDTQHHLRIPGYKQEYADGSAGWMVEKGGVPKPIGCGWLHLWVERGCIRSQVIVDTADPVPVDPVLPYGEPIYEGEDENE